MESKNIQFSQTGDINYSLFWWFTRFNRMSAPQQIILGISAYYHDSAAALVVNGSVLAAAEEERFTRKKHTADFPQNAIQFCLTKAKITLDDVDAIVFYDKPLLKFERILETAYQNIPFGFRLFHKSIPVWMKSKLNLRKTIRNELKDLTGIKFERDKILFTTHHLSHAASAFYPSPYQEAGILIIDGVGEWATVTIGKGDGKNIKLIKQMNFPDSVGLLYSAFTYFLGFKVNSGEYKLMGLSPYGELESEQTQTFIQKIKSRLVTVFPDGSIQMNRHFFGYENSLRMIKVKKWEDLFGISKKTPGQDFEQVHANLALAVQTVTEEIILKLVKTTVELTGSKNLVLAGGVALNCVANGKILERNLIDNLWIQPGAGDSGGALGAALTGCFLLNKNSTRELSPNADNMNNSLLGLEVDTDKLKVEIEKRKYVSAYIPDNSKFHAEVAHLISNDKLVGWVQDKAEFGPRALGARSIIASPLSKTNQTKINERVKFREDFRPFAPVMLKEEAIRFYGFDKTSPYMQIVQKILPEFRKELPSNFPDLTISEKVKIPTSVLEAVTHVDFSSRLQVVTEENHPFYQLLQAVKEKTGYGILLNTSFNTAGEPIVSSLSDIFDCFDKTALDYLAIDNFILRKQNIE